MLANVNFGHNFFEQFENVDSIEEMLREIDERIAYNQSSVSVTFYEDDKPVREFVRCWWGCGEPDEDCENPIVFGNFGWYGDWEEV